MTAASRIVVLVIALVLLAPAPAGWAQGGNDAAVAVNTKDGSQVFRFSFNVRRIMGDVVDTSNAAVAFASCESCQTVAISIQLVLVSGSPEVVTPENLAIAINQGCVSCETLASAYQFVLGVGPAPVHFTSEGNRTLAELRRELTRLRREEGLSIDEIQARVEAIVNRLRTVLANELVAAPVPEGAGQGGAPATTQAPDTNTGEQPTQAPATQTTEAPPTETQPTTTDGTTTGTEPAAGGTTTQEPQPTTGQQSTTPATQTTEAPPTETQPTTTGQTTTGPEPQPSGTTTQEPQPTTGTQTTQPTPTPTPEPSSTQTQPTATQPTTTEPTTTTTEPTPTPTPVTGP